VNKPKKVQLNNSIIVKSVLASLLLLGCNDSGPKSAPPPNISERAACLATFNWAYQASGKVRSTAVVDERFVYFSDSDGNLYSVYKHSGELNWQVSFKGSLDSKLVLTDDTLLVTSDAGQLIAVASKNGKLKWQAEIGAILRPEYDYNISSAVVHDGLAYIGQENGSLVGIDLVSGEITWQVDLLSPAHSQPLISDGSICISSMTELSCIDIETKEIQWRQPLDWPNSPASDGDIIIVGSRWDYGIFAFDLKTGQQRWKYTIVDWAPSEPIIQEGITYIGTSDNYAFFAIDNETGERLWRAETIANVFTKAVIADDNVIFSSGYAYNSPGYGVVKAVNLQGETTWSLPGCNFFSSPIVDASSIYIGSDDGYFYSLNINN